MTDDEEKIKSEAVAYVKKNRESIIEKFSGDDKYISPTSALSYFMAGSPGAGKTEMSKSMAQEFSEDKLTYDIIRLDPDEIRDMLPQYTGANAHVFQQPVAMATHYVFNHAIKTNKNLLLDGTFSNLDYAKQNIKKSLDKNRAIEILYMYIDPLQAWEYTQAREAKEGRRITKDAFINTLFGALETVREIKNLYGDKVNLTVAIHDYQKGESNTHTDVTDMDKVHTLPYSKKELKELMHHV